MTELAGWRETLIRQAVEQVTNRLGAPLVLDTLSEEGMMEVGYGLALSPEAREIRSALLAGRQVTVTEEALAWRQRKGLPQGLAALFRQGEQRLQGAGVTILRPKPASTGGKRPLVTLCRAQTLAERGEPLPQGALLTPLAADFWKERGEEP